jgi:hypothetical protein
MANRSDRGREQPAVTSRASKPANQNGTSSAETIKASGHDRANRPHTRLHPDQACQTLTKPLQRGSHPHRTSFRKRPFGALFSLGGDLPLGEIPLYNQTFPIAFDHQQYNFVV